MEVMVWSMPLKVSVPVYLLENLFVLSGVHVSQKLIICHIYFILFLFYKTIRIKLKPIPFHYPNYPELPLHWTYYILSVHVLILVLHMYLLPRYMENKIQYSFVSFYTFNRWYHTSCILLETYFFSVNILLKLYPR